MCPSGIWKVPLNTLSSSFASWCVIPPALLMAQPLEGCLCKPAVPLIQPCGAEPLICVIRSPFVFRFLCNLFESCIHFKVPLYYQRTLYENQTAKGSEKENICIKSAAILVQPISLTLDIDEHALFPINARLA